MPETLSTGQEIQREILDMVRNRQEELVDVIRFWADAVQAITSSVRTPSLPHSDKLPRSEELWADAVQAITSSVPMPSMLYSDTLPTPEEFVASTYDFAEQLLTSQRKFAENVLEAARPLLGAREGPAAKKDEAK